MKRRLGIALFALLLVAGARLAAQVQQQGAGAGTLVPTSSNAAAVNALQMSLEEQWSFSFSPAAEHARRALELDSQLGLARAHLARLLEGPNAASELDRAAADAATASLPEALVVQALREQQAGRARNAQRLFTLAAELLPNDPRIAMERATSFGGQQRVQLLREAAARFPGYAPAKLWLAFFLTANGFDHFSDSVASEALSAVGDAVKLAPNASGPHTMMGHVLERLLRHDEAMPHLVAATRMTPSNDWAYALEAEIALREGRYPQARAALDSAMMLCPTATRANGYRLARALSFLYERKLPQTMDSLAAMARELEAAGAPALAAAAHLDMALLSAAVHDAAGFDNHYAAAQRLHAAPAVLADNGVIALSLLGDSVRARRALDDYIRETQGVPSDVRIPNVHRMTGLELLAERKPAEAIAELKQGGDNPYAQLGLITAYDALGDRKAAAAERAAMLARRNVPYGSTATPIARYLMAVKAP